MLRVVEGQIPFSEIQRLFDEQVTEGYEVEYKQTVTFKDNEDVRELLDDLVSFANTNGGWLLIGISEANEGKKVGYPVEIVDHKLDFQDFKDRVERSVADNVKPRLPLLRFHNISCPESKSIIAIRVDSSTLRPHMVERRGRITCARRNSTGKLPMDAFELREAIVKLDSVSERFNAFVDSRLTQLLQSEFFVSPTHPVLCMHMAPLDSLEREVSLTLEQLTQANQMLRAGQEYDVHLDSINSINAEGILSLRRLEVNHINYKSIAQLFRTGWIQRSSSHPFSGKHGDNADTPRITRRKLVDTLTYFINNNLRVYRAMNLQGEIWFTCTLYSVRHYALIQGSDYGKPIKMDKLRLPILTIQSDANAKDYLKTLDPHLQLIAQASGHWEFFHEE